MKKLSKKQLLWGIIILTLVLCWFLLRGDSEETLTENTTVATKGSILQEVSVTGRVEPVTSVNLGFEKSGRIVGVYTNVGDRVQAGTLLAEIESSSAQASVLESEARLAELKRGSRKEEFDVKEAEIAKYTQDLENSYSGIGDIINDAFTKSDDVLHVKTAGMFSGFKTSSYRLTYQVCDSQLDLNATTMRQKIEYEFDQWRNEVDAQKTHTDSASLESDLEVTNRHLTNVKEFLEASTRTLTLDCTIANTSLDTYRTNMNAARANITTALSTVNSKKQSLASLKLTILKAERELALLKAGASSEAIAAEEARLLLAKGELRKYRLYAPVSGTVTQTDAKIGELANTTSPYFSIISESAFNMIAQIPESDIAKVKIGNTANITLDAYGSDVVFEGSVTSINPAETVIENVPTYKVTLNFTKSDPRIKSGMTANIDIRTSSKEGVLLLPQRAIKTVGGVRTVTIINADKTMTDLPVVVGLRGSDGLIEIISGVQEGATVLVAPKL